MPAWLKAMLRPGGIGARLREVVVEAGRHDGRVGHEHRLQALALQVGQVYPERNLQGHDHHDQQVGRSEDQPGAEPHPASSSSSGEANRNPTPRTVLM